MCRGLAICAAANAFLKQLWPSNRATHKTRPSSAIDTSARFRNGSSCTILIADHHDTAEPSLLASFFPDRATDEPVSRQTAAGSADPPAT